MRKNIVNTTALSAAGPGDKGALTYYGITLKKNLKVYPTSYEYEDYLEFIRSKGIQIMDYHMELDNDNRLHLHGTIICPKNFYLKKLQKFGWHLKLVEIPSDKDLKKWSKYTHKCYDSMYEEEQLKIANDIRVSDSCFI